MLKDQDHSSKDNWSKDLVVLLVRLARPDLLDLRVQRGLLDRWVLLALQELMALGGHPDLPANPAVTAKMVSMEGKVRLAHPALLVHLARWASSVLPAIKVQLVLLDRRVRKAPLVSMV